MSKVAPLARSNAGWRADALLALVAALLAMLFLTLAFNRVWPITVDVGVRDQRFVAGFYAVQELDGQLSRWTGGDSTLALPRPPLGVPVLAELRMSSGRPADVPDAHVTLDANGTPLGAFDVVRIVNGTRLYGALVPPNESLDWALRLHLQTSTFSLPNDSRELGAVLDQIALTPLTNGPLIPSLWLLGWAAALALCAYALARWLGLRRAASFGAALALPALLAIGVAARPLEVLPFVQRIAALVALAALGVGIARLLAPARRTGERRLVVRGADLPIYLAAMWWMAPLFQLFQNADGMPDIAPGIPTMWIGGAIILALLALGGWYAVRGRDLPEEQGRLGISRAALIIFTIAAVANLIYMITFAFGRQGPDFWILFKGARDWARGGSLYDLEAVRTNHFGKVFKVPPFYGMLFVPWVFGDGERVLFFHRVLNCILLAATFAAWVRMWGLRVVSTGTAGALILLNFRPLTDTMAYGQIDLALLLTLTLALWALRGERDILAGVLIALGTLFKIYPVLLLAFLVAKRRWRGLAGFALGMLLFNGVAVAVMGWEMHQIYLTEVLPNIGGTTSWVENQTISAFITRFVSTPAEAEIFQNRALALLGLGISGLVGLLGCVLALPPARSRSTNFALQYAQFPLLMVLVVPAAWMHYETLLFLPFGALLLHLRDREVPLGQACALALAYALTSYGNQWSYYGGPVMGFLTVLGVSYKFYGMLLLGGVLAATLLRERAPAWEDFLAWLPGGLRGGRLSRANT